jgi:ribosomal protein S18 acetylase RimI-like enzyme
MPYHKQQRPVCNRRVARPALFTGLFRTRKGHARWRADAIDARDLPIAALGTGRALEFQVRDARLTDIERISALIERTDSSWDSVELGQAADLLRQLVYLPNAAVLVAVENKPVVGVAVLALRPSVAARGLVGALDLLTVEAGSGADEIVAALLREVIRSARNKGCRELEVTHSDDLAEQARWEKLGFRAAGQRLVYPLARVPATAR